MARTEDGADYALFDGVPLLRDLVLATNPLRSLDLLASEHARLGAKPTALGRVVRGASRVVAAAYLRPLGGRRAALPVPRPALLAVGQQGTAGCDAPTATAGTTAPDSLTSVTGLGTDIDKEMVSSWASSSVEAAYGPGGVCTVGYQVISQNENGFIASVTFLKKNMEIPQMPGSLVSAELSAEVSVTRDPCPDAGTWTAPITQTSSTLPLTGKGGSQFAAWRTQGTATLTLSGDNAKFDAHFVYSSQQRIILQIPTGGPGGTTRLVPTPIVKPIAIINSLDLSGELGRPFIRGFRPATGTVTLAASGYYSGESTGGLGTEGLSSGQRYTTYTLSGSYQCEHGTTESLTLSNKTLGTLDFTQRSATPSGVHVSVDLSSEAKWRQKLDAFTAPTPPAGAQPSPTGAGTTSTPAPSTSAQSPTTTAPPLAPNVLGVVTREVVDGAPG